MKRERVVENSLLSVFGISLLFFGLTNYFGNLAFSAMLSGLGMIFQLPEAIMIIEVLERHILSR